MSFSSDLSYYAIEYTAGPATASVTSVDQAALQFIGSAGSLQELPQRAAPDDSGNSRG